LSLNPLPASGERELGSCYRYAHGNTGEGLDLQPHPGDERETRYSRRRQRPGLLRSGHGSVAAQPYGVAADRGNGGGLQRSGAADNRGWLRSGTVNLGARRYTTFFPKTYAI